MQEMEGGGGRGDLGGMDVAFEEHRRLFVVRAVFTVGHRGEPDAPTFEGRADRLERHEVRMGRGEGLESGGKFVVGVEMIESRRGHLG